MTTQEAYERIRAHFSREGAVLGKGVLADGSQFEDGPTMACVYRANGDPKSEVRCAFGVLIPDEMYSVDMEDTISGYILGKWKELAKHLEEVSPLFISNAQSLHDHAADDARHFVTLLDRLAGDYELVRP